MLEAHGGASLVLCLRFLMFTVRFRPRAGHSISCSRPGLLAVLLLTLASGTTWAQQPEPPPVCGRTPVVVHTILSAVGVARCDEVTPSQLEGITRLDFEQRQSIAALQSGDFAGLTELTTLEMWGSNLQSLPSGIFNGLANLENLRLDFNQLSSLPPGIFDGLANSANPASGD